MKKIKSPFTEKDAVIDQTYKSSELINLYNAELNMDVSRHFAGIEEIDRFICPDSGFRFFYPLNIAGDGAFYHELSKNFSNYYEVEKWEHEKAFEYIQESESITPGAEGNFLEIGCAEGAFMKKIEDQFPSLKVTGIDINESAVITAQKNGLNARLESIEDHLLTCNAKYKYVVLFQVLEHISDVAQFIKSICDLLEDKGSLIIAVPNSESYILRNDRYHTLNLPPHHMGWWDEKSLTSLANYYPIRPVQIIKEPTDYQNIGEYYKACLKHYLKQYSKLVYTLTRWFVKPFYKFAIGKNEGMSMIAIYQKK